MNTVIGGIDRQVLPEQRIVKIRRDYNTWVANQTLEDYALRFTARSFRKWSEFRVANTAFGAISFLLLEAIGASIMFNYGFVSTLWAIGVAGAVIFFTGIPISYYAAKYGVDMDLLTRGAGFGYIGSTITSLIYASFTFLFFALEATIMALALQLCFGIPLTPAYLICAVAVIPLVTHGITWISRLQAWTQPLWLVMLVLPFVFVIAKAPELIHEFPRFGGAQGDVHPGFNLLMFGAASTVLMAMVTQIGEQIDFLRFLPEPSAANRKRWWLSMLAAGPGWIVLGAARLIGGAFLAFVAIRQGVPAEHALEPTNMYRVGFGYVFSNPFVALGAMGLFVVLSQLKINVTNAYAGSLAWSNFFARVTHSHPGRVVWVIFNIAIALVLMELDVFHALERVLGLYSNVAISWVGAISADLVINKPLRLSPPGIEFKRALLYDVNPVGVGSMLIASLLSIVAFCGLLGPLAQAFSAFIALGTAFVCAPLIAISTRGRYYLARSPERSVANMKGERHCSICEKPYESEDMAFCPAYRGAICSLCCALDARCHDACKPGARLSEQFTALLRRVLPIRISTRLNTRLGHYLLLVLFTTSVLGAALWLIYHEQSTLRIVSAPGLLPVLRITILKIFGVLFVAGAIGCWWLVLAAESGRVAQEESNRQTHLLMNEIEAHRKTDAELQSAKLAAERANQAKSRYITGISHELRTPMNSILGYAQLLEYDLSIPSHRRDALSVIRRSGEHLVSLIDGLLDIAKIESGKLKLETDELRLPEFLAQIASMFRLQARNKGLDFLYEEIGSVPAVVRADKKRLSQILINVLGNAIKFTEQGSVRLTVRCRDVMVFAVHDSGAGIAQEDIQRILLPFERGGPDVEGGTGLGLTIASMLTTLMGGELAIRSEVGKGSVFEMRLFLPEVREPRTATVVPSLDLIGYAGPRRRLLMVDNEAVDRRFLVTLLGPLGFDVSEASSGIEALQLAPHIRPDLILLDIGMPGLDGWETARLLRANSVQPAPILVISADAFDLDHDRGLGIGPKDFVVKPVNVPILLARIREKLDLVWITRGQFEEGPTSGIPMSLTSPAVRDAPLPTNYREELKDLGVLGHVRGILEKLDEIDRADARFVHVTERLRRDIKAFRLSDFMRGIQADAP